MPPLWSPTTIVGSIALLVMRLSKISSTRHSWWFQVTLESKSICASYMYKTACLRLPLYVLGSQISNGRALNQGVAYAESKRNNVPLLTPETVSQATGAAAGATSGLEQLAATSAIPRLNSSPRIFS